MTQTEGNVDFGGLPQSRGSQLGSMSEWAPWTLVRKRTVCAHVGVRYAEARPWHFCGMLTGGPWPQGVGTPALERQGSEQLPHSGRSNPEFTDEETENQRETRCLGSPWELASGSQAVARALECCFTVPGRALGLGVPRGWSQNSSLGPVSKGVPLHTRVCANSVLDTEDGTHVCTLACTYVVLRGAAC